MSAAAKLFQSGTGARNLMLAVVIAGALVGVVWLIRNREKFDPTSDKNLANVALHDLLGIDTEKESLGTIAYDNVQGIKDWFGGIFGSTDELERGAEILLDDGAALRSCRMAYAKNGKVTTARCVDLISKYGA